MRLKFLDQNGRPLFFLPVLAILGIVFIVCIISGWQYNYSSQQQKTYEVVQREETYIVKDGDGLDTIAYKYRPKDGRSLDQFIEDSIIQPNYELFKRNTKRSGILNNLYPGDEVIVVWQERREVAKCE